jgi:hypothetical protein
MGSSLRPFPAGVDSVAPGRRREIQRYHWAGIFAIEAGRFQTAVKLGTNLH